MSTFISVTNIKNVRLLRRYKHHLGDIVIQHFWSRMTAGIFSWICDMKSWNTLYSIMQTLERNLVYCNWRTDTA